MEPKVTQLPIHVRRVVDAGGVMRSENEVYCVTRACSVAVAECEACFGYAGSDIDLYNHRNYVLCRHLTPDAARSVAPARPAVLRRRYLEQTTAGERTPVSAILVPDVWCVSETLELPKLRALLVERAVSGVPVVDDCGRCVGVVSSADLARAPDGAGRVRDVMARVTFVLPDNATISQAAALMALEHIHRLPIVTDDGRVAGIVTSIDVLRWLAQQDGYVVPMREYKGDPR
jgi:CBS domain-containing protein